MISRPRFQFQAREKVLELGPETRLMGVVNVTPDSFSDGGRYLDPERAVDHCLSLVDKGAEILDLGAESSRPGASPVTTQEELDRLLPVVEGVRKRVQVMISIDTYKARVAEASLEYGADIVNDISAFRLDKSMPDVVKRYRAGVVLMNMRGIPSTMHTLPPSSDIVSEVREELQIAVNKAYKSDIDHDRIMLDPGIGFGKNAQESLQLINRLTGLQSLELPILVGTSRKSFIGNVLNKPIEERLLGTIASSVVAILAGAHVLRVHDVAEVKLAARMVDAILNEGVPE